MKKIAYFLLFTMVDTRSVMDGECVYENDYTSVTCRRSVSNNFDVVIPDNIFTNITMLVLNTSSNHPWLIMRHDTFKHFYKLSDLIIAGPLKFSEDLINKQAKVLLVELLNVPSIQALVLANCSFQGLENLGLLIFPPNVSSLILDRCSHTLFDWKKPFTLRHLRIIDDTIVMLPKLGYPSLRILELFTNDFPIEISEIAFYCNLTELWFSALFLTLPQYHCECLRFLLWQKHLKHEANFELEYVTKYDLNCPGRKDQDCSKYTLDEAEINRKKCLEMKPPSGQEGTESKSLADPLTWMNFPTWIYIAVAVFLLLSLIFALMMFAIENMTNEVTIAESLDEDDDEDNIEQSESD